MRERVSTHDSGAGPDKPGSSTQETDYQTGKRTEQVVSPAGQLKRLNVAVVVRHALDSADTDKLRELVAAAVGLDRQRGDVIAVHSMAAMSGPSEAAVMPIAAKDDPAPARTDPASKATHADSGSIVSIGAALLGIAMLLAVAVALAQRRTRASAAPATLDEAQRDEVLAKVRGWLDHDTAQVARVTTGRSR